MDEIRRDDLRHESQHDRGHYDGIDGLASETCSKDLCSYDKEQHIYDEVRNSHRYAGRIHEYGRETGNTSTDEVVRKEEYTPSQSIGHNTQGHKRIFLDQRRNRSL